MKLFAIDLDGTLLDRHGGVSEDNKAAIRRAQQLGHVVMICSGRTAEDIMGILERAGLSCPVAGCNGAVVWVDGRVVQRISMNRSEAMAICRRLEQENTFYELYTNRGILMPESWPGLIDLLETSGELPKGISVIFKQHIHKLTEAGLVRFFRHQEEIWTDAGLTVEKIHMLLKDAALRASVADFLQTFPGIDVTTSEAFNLEAIHTEGHKGTGLRFVAKHFGIPMEQTVAIGNSYNDMAMFEAAGLAVAMGNSDQDIKDRCGMVTLSDEEHGVAYALSQIIDLKG